MPPLRRHRPAGERFRLALAFLRNHHQSISMGLKHYARTVAFVLAVTLFATSLSAAPGSGETTPLRSWQPAMVSFKKAGELIGRDKFEQARAELSSGTTNLPVPYGSMAAEYRGKLDAALKISNAKDFKRLEALVQLCMDLRACDAALKVRAKEGKDADPDDTAIGWRLWETGNAKGALAEYNRRLAAENVDMWRDHWKEQVHVVEQLPVGRTNVPFVVELVQKHYLKGFETKADTFSALEELTRVLPYAKTAKEAVVVHQLMVKNLDSLGDDAGRTAWENKLLSD